MRHLGGLAALAVLTAGAYWGVADFGFVRFDDDVYLVDNPQVADGITGESLAWAFTTGHHANWHPLTWLTYLAEIEIGGLDPGLMHATNVLLHFLNCVLLYALLLRSTGSTARSLIVAVIFALHPLHVESVAWISERKEVLAAAFGLLTLHAYVTYARKPSARSYGLVLLAFAACLMAKPMWVTLPILLLFFDRWPLRREMEWKRLVFEKIPLLMLAVASGLATILAQAGGDSVQRLDTIPLDQRIGNAAIAYGAYLYKTIWPTDLAVFYPHPREHLSWALAVISAAFVVVITVALFRARRTVPSLWFGWCWFMVALAPVIGILQVGGQAMADRYTYMPHIGLMAGIVFAVPNFAPEGMLRKITPAAIAGLAGMLLLLSYAQVRVWRDTESLFSHAAQVTDRNVLAHAVLAQHYLDAGNLRLAEGHSREAVTINPGFADGWRELGIALHAQGRYQDAEIAIERSLAGNEDSATAWFYLAKNCDAQGDFAGASRAFDRAAALDPENAVLRTAYGNTLARAAMSRDGTGLAAAVAQYRLAIKSDPAYSLGHLNLGRALSLMGQETEARIHLDLASALDSNAARERSGARARQ